MGITRALGLVAISALAACGLSVVGLVSPDGDGGADASSSDGLADPSPSPACQPSAVCSSSSSSSGGEAGANDDAIAPPAPTPIIYTASGTKIYGLNPITKVFTFLGDFTSCGSIEEIAVNGDGKVFATRGDDGAFLAIDIAAVKCSTIKVQSNYPISLSFVKPTSVTEVLLGYRPDGELVQIDRMNGAITSISKGALGSFAPSADSVWGGGHGYLAAVGTACSSGDCLLEIDFTNGSVIEKLGVFPEKDIHGLGYWAGKIYGCSETNGKTFVVTPKPFKLEDTLPPPSGITSWRTAGSTTRAPTQ